MRFWVDSIPLLKAKLFFGRVGSHLVPKLYIPYTGILSALEKITMNIFLVTIFILDFQG
jgi:hypothetical protein